MRQLLVTGDGFTENQEKSLQSVGYDVIRRNCVSREDLHILMPQLHAYILGGDERLESSVLAIAENLELISFVGTACQNFIDVECARSRGIEIMNTPALNVIPVTEHTIGLLIGAFRGLFAQNEAVKRGAAWVSTRELHGASVGVVGMGSIGTGVAKVLANSFQCRVMYTSRSRKPTLEQAIPAVWATTDQIFAECDAVILLVPLSDRTHHLVQGDLLSRAKRGLVLINMSSAHVVEPEALKSALHSGQVRTAAFDGYWIEPLPRIGEDAHGLLSFPDDQFIVTPHSAAKTQVWDAMVEAAVNNVIAFAQRNSNRV